jgi:hypothetical protein
VAAARARIAAVANECWRLAGADYGVDVLPRLLELKAEVMSACESLGMEKAFIPTIDLTDLLQPADLNPAVIEGASTTPTEAVAVVEEVSAGAADAAGATELAVKEDVDVDKKAPGLFGKFFPGGSKKKH